MSTSIKLSGALTGIAEGLPFHDHAMTVAWVKRALGCLHKALKGLDRVPSDKLLPAFFIEERRNEMFTIREKILRLMDEVRGRQ